MEPKPKRRACDCDYLFLPIEIWREILIRLPVKSVLQCRSVCKSWYSLISCSGFISDHSTINLKKNGSRVLLRFFDDSCVSSYSSCDDSFTKFREHDDVAKQFLSPYNVVGSCDGLICLSKYSRSVKDPAVTFFIWNPTIRKVVELPSRTFCPGTQFPTYCGFGFDSNTNDYKVLMSFGVPKKNENLSVVKHTSEIFDVRKGAWRTISPRVGSWNIGDYPNPECYLNGAVHWSGFINSKRSHRILLSFNMSEECFQVIRLPKCAEFTLNENDSECYIDSQSMTINLLIYVIVFRTRYYHEIDMSRHCALWAMKEYGVTESWTKISNIDLQRFLDNSNNYFLPQPFYLWKNDEVLVARGNGYIGRGRKQDFIVYNIGRREVRCVFTTTKYFIHLCRYEESLVLM